MPLQKRIGLGITLGVDTTLNSTNYAVLGNLVDVPQHGGTKADVADLSLLADTYKSFGKGQIDPGTWQFEIAYDPNDTNTSSKIEALHAATGVNSYNWQLLLPAIVSPGTNAVGYCNFAAHVVAKGVKGMKGDLMVQPITLQVTGDPDL